MSFIGFCCQQSRFIRPIPRVRCRRDR
jgi:hypothetical protein